MILIDSLGISGWNMELMMMYLPVNLEKHNSQAYVLMESFV